jgi:hypothetical protein
MIEGPEELLGASFFGAWDGPLLEVLGASLGLVPVDAPFFPVLVDVPCLEPVLVDVPCFGPVLVDALCLGAVLVDAPCLMPVVLVDAPFLEPLEESFFEPLGGSF